jgi:hypothetical protein
MKLGKLSLVAVVALGTSAFAIDNMKINGEAKFIYQTTDVELTAAEKAAGVDTGLFHQGDAKGQAMGGAPYTGGAAGGASLSVGMTADLVQNVSAGVEMQAFTTLGLENNLVQDTMAPGGTTRAQDSSAVSQMWLATTLGKTTVKAGRMELDTPLAFTEKWNIVKNTFEGAVVLNNDLPDTTLVGAWVGKHNGYNDALGTLGVNLLAGSTGRTVDMENFNTFGSDGAYAAGIVNKSIPNTTVQAWYYDVVQVADAYWLQADAKVDMVSVGAQYASMDPKTAVDNYAGADLDDSKIWAVKGAVDVAGVNVYAAYSKADADGTLGFANVATGDKTKIYTGDGSIYMDGIVTAPGTKTYKVGASASVMGAKLAASYCDASDAYDVSGNDISAWDVSVSGNVGPLALQAIYTDVSNDDEFAVGAAGQSNFYRGRDIESIRLIASLKF